MLLDLVTSEISPIVSRREIPMNFDIKTHLNLLNLLRNLHIKINMIFDQNALGFQLKSKVVILSQFSLRNDLHKLFLICCCSHVKRWKFVVGRRTPLGFRNWVSSTKILKGILLRVKSTLVLIKTLFIPLITLGLRRNRIGLRQIDCLKMGLISDCFSLNKFFLSNLPLNMIQPQWDQTQHRQVASIKQVHFLTFRIKILRSLLNGKNLLGLTLGPKGLKSLFHLQIGLQIDLTLLTNLFINWSQNGLKLL